MPYKQITFLKIIVTVYSLIKDAVKIYWSFMKYFLSQINNRFHVVSGIYIRQYVNSSLTVLMKMVKIGTWRIITNLQY